jgi:hypothetical protein
MGLRDIKMSIFNYMEVTDVTVNNAHLDWQYAPNNGYSSWLTILGVDYTPSDFSRPYRPLNVTVAVKGQYPELCPAAAVFGSQASCEYVVIGYDGGPNRDECCPKGVTAYYSPGWLQTSAGIWPNTVSG